MLSRFCWFKVLAVLLLLSAYAFADAAPFDLFGPKIEVKVTRGGKTLPISQVPNLQAGDRVWIHPVLPPGQAVHFLLIATFLRGSTNPPPENWFTKAETWTKEVGQEGIFVTVPQDAQQTVLMFAPQSGGDFSSLRSAVRGKPGAFVRAAQDLYQASLDRARLDKYLEEVKATSKTAPEALHQRSVLLARSLNIKLDEHCFDKPTEQQAPCLMQNSDQLVLDDEHSQSMVAALTTGASADLIGQLSSTKQAGGGSYSPYVGAVVDVVKLMDGFHTPNYQYIPALALPKQNELNLRLNNAPSFKKPKSVMVIGLPGIEAVQFPPLRRVDADRVYCLQNATQALELEGAPLVYATELAHDMVLHVIDPRGKSLDLPVKADAAHGGFLVDAQALASANLGAAVTGTLQGYWGFDRFDGPTFTLRNARPAEWTLPPADKTGLIVGRTNTLHLHSDEAACVDQVNVKPAKGEVLKASWKSPKPNELEVEAALKDVEPGPITLLVQQYGTAKPDEVPLQAYSESANLERFTIRAGDQQGVLTGTRLDEVAALELGGVRFVPGTLSRNSGRDELQMAAPSPPANSAANEKQTAHVTLKDGRTLEVAVTVGAPRPKITVLSKNIQPGTNASARYIRLANQDDLPQDWRLSFFFRSDMPAAFPRDEKIEIANGDGSLNVQLSIGEGGLVLQDSATVLANFDPLKSFGPSAFGTLRVRPVAGDGAAGEWQPLIKLIRVPSLKEIHCPGAADQQCTLQGTNLFFLDSVASDAQFIHAVPVPQGFAGTSLHVPRPDGTLLYLKLRDDPSAVSTASLPVLPDP